MLTSRPVLRRSLLVAGVVTLAAGALLAGVLAISDTLFIHGSSVDLDSDVQSTYQAFVRHPALLNRVLVSGRMGIPAGLVVWRIDADGNVSGTAGLPPPLPGAYHRLQGHAQARFDGITYRLVGGPLADGWLVVGGDVAVVVHPQQDVLNAQLVTLPPALVAVFLGALAVARWVAGPIERARQHQMAFTANASHELRTPLAVLEGEVSLARSRPRSTDEYRHALDRIAGETAAVHGLVDDLLWLARFESEPRPPVTEAVHLDEAARQAGERFSSLARNQDLDLSVVAEMPAVVEAPGPWIDRLIGVMLANACAYTPRGGRVQVTVLGDPLGSAILVDDSGPGIPPEQRDRIFERFYRGTARGDGAGLGLSIADAIVKATGGRWEVTTSPLGGARFLVRWSPAAASPGSALRRLGWLFPAPSPARKA
jgi:signal transduction histidine kinase